MRGAGEHCKENNAALCKCNCAAGQAGPIYMWASLWTDNRTIQLVYPVNKVDREIIIGVITFTPVSVRSPGHTHDKTHVHRPQNGSPAPIWNTQPTPGRRDRRAFQSQRVLRCAGCGSGQVRDAASCRERRPSDYRSSLRVWLLATIVLSGPARLRAEWHRRPCATQTWTQASTQANQRDHRLSSPTPPGRSFAGFGRTGRAHQETLRCERPP